MHQCFINKYLCILHVILFYVGILYLYSMPVTGNWVHEDLTLALLLSFFVTMCIFVRLLEHSSNILPTATFVFQIYNNPKFI